MSSIPKFPLNCLANFRSFPISCFFVLSVSASAIEGSSLGKEGR
jgi:hypothetical protein